MAIITSTVGNSTPAEGSQLLSEFPAWAPKPAYRENGRPVITMIEWLDRQSRARDLSIR